ncbi:MAG: hypothetical protein HOV80_18435 [Polyangiaceae bacterium]|nr:hypothetical protein [Polyangiaceae bacterium]
MAALVFASGGCELIASVDHDKIPQGGGAPIGGGGGGTTTATTTGMGGTGGTGGSEMCVASECPDPGSDCLAKACDGDVCGEPTNVPADSACASAPGEGGGGGGNVMAGVCDGMGLCVECNGNAQCTAPEVCDTDAHQCVPAACQNGMLDPGETDTDCGGDDCGPCINGDACVDEGDCLSGFCDNLVCAACTNTGDCGANQWCDTTVMGGTCVATKADGITCGASDECMSGQCPSNGTGQPQVCCNTACNAGCKACIAAMTAGNDGVCSDVDVGQDPKDACTDTATNCQADACAAGGVCANETAGDACGSGPMCAGSTLNPQDTCDAAGACQGGTAAACPDNFACNGATACFSGTCADHVQCAAGFFCGGFMGAGGTAGDCTAKLANGQTCAVNEECTSNNCNALMCAP